MKLHRWLHAPPSGRIFSPLVLSLGRGRTPAAPIFAIRELSFAPMSMLATEAPSLTNGELIRRFFSYYKPHQGLFALDFSCAVLSGLLELGFPMAVGLFVDRLLPGQNWGLILFAATALLVIYVLNTGLLMVVNY